MKIKLTFLFLTFIFASSVNYAQDSPVIVNLDDLFKCETTATYVNLNKKEPKALTVSVVQGLAVVYASENIPPKSNILIEGACVALFTEEDHRLVAQTISDETDGNFIFKDIPAGNYRLIIRHPMGIMNVANIPIRVVTKSNKNKRIVVYMIGTNFAENSFAKVKKKK